MPRSKSNWQRRKGVKCLMCPKGIVMYACMTCQSIVHRDTSLQLQNATVFIRVGGAGYTSPMKPRVTGDGCWPQKTQEDAKFCRRSFLLAQPVPKCPYRETWFYSRFTESHCMIEFM